MYIYWDPPQYVRDMVRIAFVGLIAILCMKFGANSPDVCVTLEKSAFIIDAVCLLVFIVFAKQVPPFGEKRIPNVHFREIINKNIRGMKIEIGSRIAACLLVAVFAILLDFIGSSTISVPFSAWFAFIAAIFCSIYTLVNLQGLAEFNADVHAQIQRELVFRLELLEKREQE